MSNITEALKQIKQLDPSLYPEKTAEQLAADMQDQRFATSFYDTLQAKHPDMVDMPRDQFLQQAMGRAPEKAPLDPGKLATLAKNIKKANPQFMGSVSDAELTKAWMDSGDLGKVYDDISKEMPDAIDVSYGAFEEMFKKGQEPAAKEKAPEPKPEAPKEEEPGMFEEVTKTIRRYWKAAINPVGGLAMATAEDIVEEQAAKQRSLKGADIPEITGDEDPIGWGIRQMTNYDDRMKIYDSNPELVERGRIRVGSEAVQNYEQAAWKNIAKAQEEYDQENGTGEYDKVLKEYQNMVLVAQLSPTGRKDLETYERVNKGKLEHPAIKKALGAIRGLNNARHAQLALIKQNPNEAQRLIEHEELMAKQEKLREDFPVLGAVGRPLDYTMAILGRGFKNVAQAAEWDWLNKHADDVIARRVTSGPNDMAQAWSHYFMDDNGNRVIVDPESRQIIGARDADGNILKDYTPTDEDSTRAQTAELQTEFSKSGTLSIVADVLGDLVFDAVVTRKVGGIAKGLGASTKIASAIGTVSAGYLRTQDAAVQTSLEAGRTGGEVWLDKFAKGMMIGGTSLINPIEGKWAARMMGGVPASTLTKAMQRYSLGKATWTDTLMELGKSTIRSTAGEMVEETVQDHILERGYNALVYGDEFRIDPLAISETLLVSGIVGAIGGSVPNIGAYSKTGLTYDAIQTVLKNPKLVESYLEGVAAIDPELAATKGQKIAEISSALKAMEVSDKDLAKATQALMMRGALIDKHGALKETGASKQILEPLELEIQKIDNQLAEIVNPKLPKVDTEEESPETKAPETLTATPEAAPAEAAPQYEELAKTTKREVDPEAWKLGTSTFVSDVATYEAWRIDALDKKPGELPQESLKRFGEKLDPNKTIREQLGDKAGIPKIKAVPIPKDLDAFEDLVMIPGLLRAGNRGLLEEEVEEGDGNKKQRRKKRLGIVISKKRADDSEGMQYLGDARTEKMKAFRDIMEKGQKQKWTLDKVYSELDKQNIQIGIGKDILWDQKAQGMASKQYADALIEELLAYTPKKKPAKTTATINVKGKGAVTYTYNETSEKWEAPDGKNAPGIRVRQINAALAKEPPKKPEATTETKPAAEPIVPRKKVVTVRDAQRNNITYTYDPETGKFRDKDGKAPTGKRKQIVERAANLTSKPAKATTETAKEVAKPTTKPVSEAQKTAIAEEIGAKVQTKPRNIKGLLQVMSQIFGLNNEQAKAAAAVGDALVTTMAKRAGITKDEMYQRIAYEKSTMEGLPKGVKLQDIETILDVYHGTSKDKDFKKFRDTGKGVFVTVSPQEASNYATENDSMKFGDYDHVTGKFAEINTASRVIPMKLELGKAYKITSEDFKFLNSKPNYGRLQKELHDKIKREGYDVIDYGKGVYAVLSEGRLRSMLTNEVLFQENTNIPEGVKFQIDAWHGSPHQVDKFSTENIGTGEGAQAFGWGLYFTDLENIARYYAEKLSTPVVEINGIDKKDYKYPSDIDIVVQAHIQHAIGVGIKDKYNKRISIDYLEGAYVRSGREVYKKALDFINNNNISVDISRNLYKVSLHKGKTPDQYTWLEWDKSTPYSIINKIKKVLPELSVVNKSDYDVEESFGYGGTFRGYVINSNRGGNLGGLFRTKEEAESYLDKSVNSGQSIYESISEELGSDKAASKFLLENGIDGIKFPAESVARGTTSDTARGFNYVVFDENAVSIEEVIKFQKDAIQARGAMMTAMDNQAIVYALTDPNVSTPMHELAHVYEHYLTDAERNAILDWAGHKKWTVKTSEKFARGFEKYLADGIAPTPKLKKAFESFKQWLTDIYNGVTGSDIDLELNDTMVDIYSTMLGEEIPKASIGSSPTQASIPAGVKETIDAYVDKQIAEGLPLVPSEVYPDGYPEGVTEATVQARIIANLRSNPKAAKGYLNQLLSEAFPTQEDTTISDADRAWVREMSGRVLRRENPYAFPVKALLSRFEIRRRASKAKGEMKKFYDLVGMIQKSFKDSGIQIFVHDTVESYANGIAQISTYEGTTQSLAVNSKGIYGNGQIHLFTGARDFTAETALHEAIHPMLIDLIAKQPNLYKDLVSNMVSDPILFERYWAGFAWEGYAQVAPETPEEAAALIDELDNEALTQLLATETMAKVFQNLPKQRKSVRERLQNFLNDVLSALGLTNAAARVNKFFDKNEVFDGFFDDLSTVDMFSTRLANALIKGQGIPLDKLYTDSADIYAHKQKAETQKTKEELAKLLEHWRLITNGNITYREFVASLEENPLYMELSYNDIREVFDGVIPDLFTAEQRASWENLKNTTPESWKHKLEGDGVAIHTDKRNIELAYKVLKLDKRDPVIGMTGADVVTAAVHDHHFDNIEHSLRTAERLFSGEIDSVPVSAEFAMMFTAEKAKARAEELEIILDKMEADVKAIYQTGHPDATAWQLFSKQYIAERDAYHAISMAVQQSGTGHARALAFRRWGIGKTYEQRAMAALKPTAPKQYHKKAEKLIDDIRKLEATIEKFQYDPDERVFLQFKSAFERAFAKSFTGKAAPTTAQAILAKWATKHKPNASMSKPLFITTSTTPDMRQFLYDVKQVTIIVGRDTMGSPDAVVGEVIRLYDSIGYKLSEMDVYVAMAYDSVEHVSQSITAYEDWKKETIAAAKAATKLSSIVSEFAIDVQKRLREYKNDREESARLVKASQLYPETQSQQQFVLVNQIIDRLMAQAAAFEHSPEQATWLINNINRLQSEFTNIFRYDYPITEDKLARILENARNIQSFQQSERLQRAMADVDTKLATLKQAATSVDPAAKYKAILGLTPVLDKKYEAPEVAKARAELAAKRRELRRAIEDGNRATRGKILTAITKTLSTIRVSKTMFDMSSFSNQGGMALRIAMAQGAYSLMGGSMKNQFSFTDLIEGYKKSWIAATDELTKRDESKTIEAYESIINDPMYAVAKMAKLAITVPKEGMDLAEEYFMDSYLDDLGKWARTGDKNKILAGMADLPSRIKDASESHYVTYLNHLRFAMFKAYYQQAAELQNGIVTVEEMQLIAESINVWTGRADTFLGHKVSPIVSSFLWAPRYYAAQIKGMMYLVTSPLRMAQAYARIHGLIPEKAELELYGKEAMNRKYAGQIRAHQHRTAGTIAQTLVFLAVHAGLHRLFKLACDEEEGGGGLGLDYRRSDFLRLRCGSAVYEYMAGNAYWLRTGAQMLDRFAEATNANITIGGTSYPTKTGPLADQNVWTLGMRVLEGKLNPVVSVGKTLATRRDFRGRLIGDSYLDALFIIGRDALTPLTISAGLETIVELSNDDDTNAATVIARMLHFFGPTMHGAGYYYSDDAMDTFAAAEQLDNVNSERLLRGVGNLRVIPDPKKGLELSAEAKNEYTKLFRQRISQILLDYSNRDEQITDAKLRSEIRKANREISEEMAKRISEGEF